LRRYASIEDEIPKLEIIGGTFPVTKAQRQEKTPTFNELAGMASK
jgi:hypothetical protein